MQYIAAIAARMEEASRSSIALTRVVGPLMAGDKPNLFYNFIKMNPLVFCGMEFEDAYEFIIDYWEWLHMVGVVERYGVELVIFLILGRYQDMVESLYGV